MGWWPGRGAGEKPSYFFSLELFSAAAFCCLPPPTQAPLEALQGQKGKGQVEKRNPLPSSPWKSFPPQRPPASCRRRRREFVSFWADRLDAANKSPILETSSSSFPAKKKQKRAPFGGRWRRARKRCRTTNHGALFFVGLLFSFFFLFFLFFLCFLVTLLFASLASSY